MNVHILAVAQLEVEEASDYYEEQREGLGHRFILEFENTLAAIQEFPGLGTKIEEIAEGGESRSFLTGSFFEFTNRQFTCLR